jgi:hypothetical protein
MIFIAYNYEGAPISVVCAKNQDLANAYWQGAGIIPHSSKCLEKDFTPIDEHITGVFPLIKTKEISPRHLNDTNPDAKIVCIAK